MPFSEIKSNENLIGRLRQMIRSGRIFHGYIFEGEKEETEALAESFAEAALCERQDGDSCGICVSCRKIRSGNSENIIRIGDDRSSIKDKDIEMLIARAMKKSYTDKRTFMIIRQAGTMTLRAQNRLLKTLEEPPGGVTIMLLAENAESLVETIRSRCQHLKLFSEGIEKNPDADNEFREQAIAAAVKIIYGKPFYELWKDIEDFSEDKKKAAAFAGIAETFYRDVLISGWDISGRLIINKDKLDIIEKCSRRFEPQRMAEAILCAEAAVKDLERNMGAGRALKYMVFDIREKLSQDVSRKD